ncbi:MAG: curli biogenesis system outer membrane secretion channel CsgG [Paraglaciecola sp.]|jgi:curli biogenesis system outer membrane secretion channel CsgG
MRNILLKTLYKTLEENMKRIAIISIGGLITLQALSGCTSATRGAVNKVESTTPMVSQTLMAPEEKGLKRVVAISRFSDETKRSNNFLVDNNGDRLGKQAADILSSRLTETQKFIMLERQELDEVQTENDLNNTQLEKVGADYLIVGSVSEFGRSTNSEVGVFSRNKVQTASATVNVRLVKTKTGQIVYSEEATGEARTEANRVFGVGETAAYDTSLDDRAISAAISKLVSNIVENLMDAPWQAYLIGEQNGQYLMTGGIDQGIEIGNEFALLAKGKQMKNPQTGMMIELPGQQVATIAVKGFMGSGQNALSLTEIVSGSIGTNAIEQLVVREIKE